MSDDFLVNTDSLTTDSETWSDWETQLTAIGTAIPTVGFGVGLEMLSFSILPGGQDVMQAYASVSSSLRDATEAGAEQFAGFSTKLTTVAGRYSTAEQDNLDDIAAAVAEVDEI